jgi:hypothetical protein
MTEMLPEKKGRMKVTIELEINDQLMDLAKDAMSKMSTKLPDMMKRGGENKQ